MTPQEEELLAKVQAVLGHLSGLRLEIRVSIAFSPDLTHQHTYNANTRGFFTDGVWEHKPYGRTDKGTRLHPSTKATYFVSFRRRQDGSIRLYIQVLPEHNWDQLCKLLRRIR